MASSGRRNAVTITALVFGLSSLFFCSCAFLVAFSYPMGNVEIDSIDTSIFTPELSMAAGACLLIPALLSAVAAVSVWYGFGRLPMQRELSQIQSEADQLRELALQTCLDQLNHLILQQNQQAATTANEQVQLAQQRLNQTWALLDPNRRQLLQQFLQQSHLIGPDSPLKLPDLDVPATTR